MQAKISLKYWNNKKIIKISLEKIDKSWKLMEKEHRLCHSDKSKNTLGFFIILLSKIDNLQNVQMY
jgi:hypothetical protein